MPAVFWGQQIVCLHNKSVLYAHRSNIKSPCSSRIAARNNHATSDRYYFWQRIIISAGRISVKEESNYYKPSGLTSCLVISPLCSVISVSNLSVVRVRLQERWMSSTTGPSRKKKGRLGGGGCRDRGRSDTLREYSPYAAVPMRVYTRAYVYCMRIIHLYACCAHTVGHFSLFFFSIIFSSPRNNDNQRDAPPEFNGIRHIWRVCSTTMRTGRELNSCVCVIPFTSPVSNVLRQDACTQNLITFRYP